MRGVGADHPVGEKEERRRHNRLDILRFDDVRRRTGPLATSKDTCRWNLVCRILRQSKQAEVADGIEPAPGHVLRARSMAPIVNAVDPGVLIAKTGCIIAVLPKLALLFVKLEPKVTMKRHVARNVRAQHAWSTGQACVNFMSIGQSHLA